MFQIGGDIQVEIDNLDLLQGGSGQGGGLYVSGGADLTLDNATFDLNQANTQGGGLYPDNAGGTIAIHGRGVRR